MKKLVPFIAMLILFSINHMNVYAQHYANNTPRQRGVGYFPKNDSRSVEKMQDDALNAWYLLFSDKAQHELASMSESQRAVTYKSFYNEKAINALSITGIKQAIVSHAEQCYEQGMGKRIKFDDATMLTFLQKLEFRTVGPEYWDSNESQYILENGSIGWWDPRATGASKTWVIAYITFTNGNSVDVFVANCGNMIRSKGRIVEERITQVEEKWEEHVPPAEKKEVVKYATYPTSGQTTVTTTVSPTVIIPGLTGQQQQQQQMCGSHCNHGNSQPAFDPNMRVRTRPNGVEVATLGVTTGHFLYDVLQDLRGSRRQKVVIQQQDRVVQDRRYQYDNRWPEPDRRYYDRIPDRRFQGDSGPNWRSSGTNAYYDRYAEQPRIATTTNAWGNGSGGSTGTGSNGNYSNGW